MIPLRDDNPSSTRPLVNYLIILINVLVFLYMSTLPARTLEGFVFAHGAIPADLVGRGGVMALGAYPTLFTSMFMHGGWVHLGGNMLYLWIFGDNVEDAMGHVNYLLFYLLAGLAAAWTHVLVNPASRAPLVGASGAIAGVLGAYTVLFPRARIVTLVFFAIFIRFWAIPAVFFLPIWFLMQLFSGWISLHGGGETVAWWAHVGGFIAGAVLVWVFAQRRRRTAAWW